MEHTGPTMSTRDRTPLYEFGTGWDTCLYCGDDFRLTFNGRLAVHGPAQARCQGGGSYGAFVKREIAARAGIKK